MFSAISDQWNCIIKRRKMLEALIEAHHIEAINEANQSWVTSAELRQRLVQRGIEQNNRRSPGAG